MDKQGDLGVGMVARGAMEDGLKETR